MSKQKDALQFAISKGLIDPVDFIIHLEDAINGLSNNNKGYIDAYTKQFEKICELEKQEERSLKERNELAEREYKTVLSNSKLFQELKEKNQCIIDLCEEIRCLKTQISKMQNWNNCNKEDNCKEKYADSGKPCPCFKWELRK